MRLDCSKLDVNQQNGNDVIIFWHDVIIRFFDVFFVSLVNFSYWCKFHISIITGSGVMTISFHKQLTRYPETRNNPFWVLPNIWRLERVRNTKFGKKVSNKMLVSAAEWQSYSFYQFWGMNRKPTVGRVGVNFPLPPPSPTRLVLNLFFSTWERLPFQLGLSVKKRKCTELDKERMSDDLMEINDTELNYEKPYFISNSST